MTDEIVKKKQHTTRELLAGGGVVMLGLPLIGFALVMSLLAVLIAVALILTQPEYTSSWLVMLTGYLLCLGALSFFSYRVIRRGGFLIGRMRGLRREKQRTAALSERDTSHLELNTLDMDTVTLPDDESNRQKNSTHL